MIFTEEFRSYKEVALALSYELQVLVLVRLERQLVESTLSFELQVLGHFL